MRRPYRLSLLALSFALGATSNALAEGPSLTTIDFPGATSTQTWGINPRGDIVGLYVGAGVTHGFLLSGGRFTPIDVPGADVSEAFGINPRREIVGDYTVAGVTHGFLLSEDTFTPIDLPGASLTSPGGINARGDIVGGYSTAGVSHAFLLSDGVFTSFDFPGAAFTTAFGINPGGEIVGRYRDAVGVAHGYLLSGQFTTIDFPGAVFTDATAINPEGDVLGRYRSVDGVFNGFLLSRRKRREGRYTITDLGTLPGGTFSQATFVNNRGLVSGLATGPDGTQHAVLWYKGRIVDIAQPGLGGPNSGAFGVNERGQAMVQAETSTNDPNSENFCGYGTGLTCLPALWQDGMMTPLPTLGGNNGTVGQINNRGEVAGIAENRFRDPKCATGVAVNGTGPQVLDFEAVIWGPRQGEIRELRPLPGDSVGMALWINDNGQAVGSSGSCSNTVLPPFAAGPHAVLWEKDGSVTDLNNLGGTVNPALLGIGNIAFSINNRGQVVGASALPGDTTTHAFLWTRERGMRDLGTLPGDVNSAGLGINDRGEVVGASINGSVASGNPRAVLWEKGVPLDLNTLIPPNSPLYLLTAFGINDVGEIAGFGVTSTSDIHGFLAIPRHGEDDNESADLTPSCCATAPAALDPK